MVRTRRSTVAGGAMVAILTTLYLIGGGSCFDPKIGTMLRCAPSGKQCPDGFGCAVSTGFCVPAADVGGQGGISGGTGGSGSGGTGGDCATPPLCQSPGGFVGCDTVCQVGCACGMRCSVTSSGAGCASPKGTKGLGEICNSAADDCGLGYVCLKESCGTNLARCYRFCRDASPCGTNGVCGTQVALAVGGGSTGQLACNLGDTSCNAFARTGCPDPALNCYVNGGNHTKCDCPGLPSGMERQKGQSCVNYNDCAPGLACLTIAGASNCYATCNSAADCPNCVTLGSAGGYCP